VKIPQRHRIGFFRGLVLLDRNLIDVADRLEARVGLRLQGLAQIIVEMRRGFIVQIAFLLVLLLDDLDRLGPVRLEVGDAFAEASEEFIDDVRMRRRP